MIKNFNIIIKKYYKRFGNIMNSELNTFIQYHVRDTILLSLLNSRCIFIIDINMSFILKLTSEIHSNNMNILNDLFSFSLIKSNEESEKIQAKLLLKIFSLFYT